MSRADRLAGCDAGADALAWMLDRLEGEDRPTVGNGLLPADGHTDTRPDPPRADPWSISRHRPRLGPVAVYIASPWPLKAAAECLADALLNAGLVVTARWLQLGNIAQDDDAGARMDLADIAAADAVLLINPPGWENHGTGGRHVECGYALALRKRLIVLGVRSNVFHRLNDVTVVATVDEAIAALRRGGIHG